MEGIWVAVIGGVCGLGSAGISVLVSQAVINEKIKALQKDAEKNDDLAERVAVLESQNKTLIEDVKIIKNVLLGNK